MRRRFQYLATPMVVRRRFPRASGLQSIEALFSGGQQGGYWDFTDSSTLWQDTGATTPVTTNGDPIARVDDKSGNGNNLTQATSTKRPAWFSSGGDNYLTVDQVDDALDVTVPTGGFNGTVVFANPDGCFSFDIAETAGAKSNWLPSGWQKILHNGCYAILVTDEVLTDEELADVETIMEAKGASAAITRANCGNLFAQSGSIASALRKFRRTDYSAVTVIGGFADSGNITDFNSVQFTGGLTSAAYAFAHNNMTSLAGTRWTGATSLANMFAFGVGSLTTCPANVFHDVASSCAFNSTFASTAFDAASVNNILIDLDAAGLTGVTIDIAGANAAPTGAGLTAKTNLQGRGCTVNTN